jgi:aminoglycoside phosphotransferase (APT) family kinase protein
MEAHAPETKELCLIHGDYHAMNVLVRNDYDLVIIDWMGARIGNFRSDLAFAILTLASADLCLEDTIVTLYETQTGKRVENLDYFTALSCIWNLVRIYSCAFDRSIIGEDDESARLFLREYHRYSRLLVETVQKATGVALPRLPDAIWDGELN